MYLPHHFAVDDPGAVAGLIEACGSAELITFDGTRPVASLLPVLWEPAGPRLLGHLARANTQWSTVAAGSLALAVVTGPQGYVSPSWYASKAEHGRVVPTWNYVSVHLTGELRVQDDPDWVRDVVTRLTERHEAGRPHAWAVGDAPPAYVSGQLRAIVGVELLVTSVEAKWKVSQNRGEADQRGVREALLAEGRADLADAMPPLTDP
jgi:transcriptional regulator